MCGISCATTWRTAWGTCETKAILQYSLDGLGACVACRSCMLRAQDAQMLPQQLHKLHDHGLGHRRMADGQVLELQRVAQNGLQAKQCQGGIAAVLLEGRTRLPRL